jgi:hypothetical protein
MYALGKAIYTAHEDLANVQIFPEWLHREHHCLARQKSRSQYGDYAT